jgi:anti-sigma-K factor RskA
MTCEGLPPIHYDLYVLGLLDQAETEMLNEHVERHCGTCLTGVSRSMRLWGVFTSTLGAAEPSSHFKERLQEIVALSHSVLTFPKGAVVETHEQLPKWVQIAIATTAAAMLTMCGWYAGHTSASVDHQHLVTRVTQSEQELSSSRLEAQQQHQQTDRARAALTASGHADALSQLASVQDRLRRSEAEAAQYKSLLGRTQRAEDNRKDMLLLLSSPNARLVPLKGAQSSPSGLGYVLVVPNSKLVFVASNLADLSGGREYQLWIMEKSPAKPRSAGTFVPDEGGHAYLQVDDGQVVSDPEAFAVTDEPGGGSSEPSGSQFLVSED